MIPGCVFLTLPVCLSFRIGTFRCCRPGFFRSFLRSRRRAEGIQLERGYVADEDTTIYNPGLSLLTESEKERLVEAVIDARKAGLEGNQWSENNEYAFEFLRQKLDPFHTTELRGFLGIVPFYGAAIYLAVLAVQQLFRDGFQIAYLVGVAAFFLPIVGLVLAGP